MKRWIFIGFIAFGTLVGLVSGVNSDWDARIVMMCVGALAGVAIGGGVTRMGSKPLPKTSWFDLPYGDGSTEDELVKNYWRDRGHAPFTKPPEAVPDKHLFDPDRFG